MVQGRNLCGLTIVGFFGGNIEHLSRFEADPAGNTFFQLLLLATTLLGLVQKKHGLFPPF